MQRPRSVTVIGWLYIGLGVLGAFGGLFGLLISFVMPTPPTPSPQDVAGMPVPFRIMTGLFDYFWLMAAVELLVAAAMTWGGTAFLKLRAWARSLLEFLAWLFLAYDLAFGAFWLWLVASMARQVPTGSGAPAMFFPIFLAFGAVIILAFAVPPVVIIRVLRGQTV